MKRALLIISTNSSVQKIKHLQFQPTKPSSSSHSIAISIHIHVSLHKPNATLLFVADIITIKVALRNEGIERRYFRSEEWEGDDPEDDSEDVEAEDCPVVICYWCCGAGYYDVDCNNNSRDGLCIYVSGVRVSVSLGLQ
jgi:hypothetical protein